jgi:hypothetical protein
MAVRDDRQPVMGKGASGGLPPRDILGSLPVILVASGLLMYAYLSVCYDRFYGSLGVDPNDVGLSYTGTLTRSSGFVIAYVFLFALMAWGPLFARMGDARKRRADPTSTPRFALPIALALSVAFSVLGLSVPWIAAKAAARHVRAGGPVSPIRVASLSVLAIHADSAKVEPAGKPGDSPAAERLQSRRLLYLGQADGTVVLYDAAAQRAVYVPGSSIVLHVAYCRGGNPPDFACRQP